MEFAYKLAAEKIHNDENDKHNDVILLKVPLVKIQEKLQEEIDHDSG